MNSKGESSLVRSPTSMTHRNYPTPSNQLPSVVTLNCIEDVTLEEQCLAGIATVDHVPLSNLSDSRIDSASAVLIHSLAFLPRAAQRRLRPWQLILCLGSSDRSVDSALAADLGLSRLVHVDVSRAEEVADTVMALILGLLRRTHLLSRQTSPSTGWLGSVQPLCRGMRRCRGLVLGIIGRSASAKCLATRSLAFRISVLYFDVQGGEGRIISFPPDARKMDTLNDLLAASDIISLHCTLTDETLQIINSESIHHIKPGSFLVNTGSSQLLDDCAVKQLLIDGTLAGCALDGAEGPQWMEAWVREMPNVLILPRSADYSEEVWMEIRKKALYVLQVYFLDNVLPDNAVSDEEDEVEDESQSVIAHAHTHTQPVTVTETETALQITEESSKVNVTKSKASKKARKRLARQKTQQKIKDSLNLTTDPDPDPVLSSSSRFASPDDTDLVVKEGFIKKTGELLMDGYIIALHTRDNSGLYVSRQRVKEGGWFLDTMSSVTKQDPAAQFLVVFRSKDIIGLRSFTAGGKLLQINRRMEFVFASHSFDVWESWTIEGSLEECRLVNCRNPLAFLDVGVEVLAAIGEEGITRWLE